MEINLQNIGPLAIFENLTGQMNFSQAGSESTFYKLFNSFGQNNTTVQTVAGLNNPKDLFALYESISKENPGLKNYNSVIAEFLSRYGGNSEKDSENGKEASLNTIQESLLSGLKKHKEAQNNENTGEAENSDINLELHKSKINQTADQAVVIEDPVEISAVQTADDKTEITESKAKTEVERTEVLSDLKQWYENLQQNKSNSISEEDIEKALQFFVRYFQFHENSTEQNFEQSNPASVNHAPDLEMFDSELMDIIKNVSEDSNEKTKLDQVKEWFTSKTGGDVTNYGQIVSALVKEAHALLGKNANLNRADISNTKSNNNGDIPNILNSIETPSIEKNNMNSSTVVTNSEMTFTNKKDSFNSKPAPMRNSEKSIPVTPSSNHDTRGSREEIAKTDGLKIENTNNNSSIGRNSIKSDVVQDKISPSLKDSGEEPEAFIISKEEVHAKDSLIAEDMPEKGTDNGIANTKDQANHNLHAGIESKSASGMNNAENEIPGAMSERMSVETEATVQSDGNKTKQPEGSSETVLLKEANSVDKSIFVPAPEIEKTNAINAAGDTQKAVSGTETKQDMGDFGKNHEEEQPDTELQNIAKNNEKTVKANVFNNEVKKDSKEEKAANYSEKAMHDISDKLERLNAANISYKEENNNNEITRNRSENINNDVLKNDTATDLGHKADSINSNHKIDKVGTSMLQTPQSEKVESEKSVMNQLINKASLELGKNKSELKIDIKPDHLGSIKINIISEHQQITAKISAENVHVKEIIEHNLDQLKADLNKAGLQIDSVDVSVDQDENFEHSGAKENLAKQVRNLAQFRRGGLNGSENENKNDINKYQKKETAIDYYA